jgi:hypothetical protein
MEKMLLRFIVPALLIAFSASSSRADLIYTWHETDGAAVTGSLDVSSAALTSGSISFSDVESFSFIGPGFSYNAVINFSPNVYPIDSTGMVTSPNSVLESPDENVLINFSDRSFNPSAPVTWGNAGPGLPGGNGFWTVQITWV